MSRILLIGVCLSAALAACASAPPSTHMASNVACKAATGPGPRAPLNPGQCRSYSGEELQRTGEVNVGDALGKLDPAVTVQHH